ARAQAGAERPPHVDALPVAALLVAARAPDRRLEPESRHQLVELHELVRLQRVEALAGEPFLVARHRQRDLDLGLLVVTGFSRRANRAAVSPRALLRRTASRSGPHL